MAKDDCSAAAKFERFGNVGLKTDQYAKHLNVMKVALLLYFFYKIFHLSFIN